MVDTSFLPVLSQFDIERAAQLIQQAYEPQNLRGSAEDVRQLQQELFEIQKRPEAWGLVIPLLDHMDPNVQFFGAHTAQVKIARDWDSFPLDHAEQLRDLIVQLTAHSLAIGRGKFILRKLFVSLTSLALKLVPGRPTRWPDWIQSCITLFSERGAAQEHVQDFLAIVAEELGNADLLGPSKMQMQQTLLDAVPIVEQLITSSISQPNAASIPSQTLKSALRCLQAWLYVLPTSNITPLLPMLISLLDMSETNEDAFIASSDTLQELMSKSALSGGSGSKTLTEPLLLWLYTSGRKIVENTLSTGIVLPASHSLCKLLTALGDHSTGYFATNIANQLPVGVSSYTRAQLVQAYLQMFLAYTGLQGYYGVDEEESEMTLGFWYLFQEALWNTDYYFQQDDEGSEETLAPSNEQESEQVVTAKAVYIELVKTLRRKVAYPPPGSGWSKDQIERFQVYRRDVGDTLINAYYVLRDDMLGYYVNDIAERLGSRQEGQGWQEIEATLHCIMSIQEALDLERTPHLIRLFSPQILGQFPQTGHSRIRRTTLSVVGAYASWFATQPAQPPPAGDSGLLMTVLSYVVAALPDQPLSLQAAVALRNLCDANRKTLAPHIAAFGELHAGLERIADSEKSKVLQSISSVIQALPAEEEIPPIEAIVNPIINKLSTALQSATTLPEDSRAMIILQLETLAGVAKGLTRLNDGLGGPVEEFDPAMRAELEAIMIARADGRMTKLRDDIFGAVRTIMQMWSEDAEVGHTLSDLFKNITSLPSDITLITLPAGPLLELVCLAVGRRLTAAWLSLAAILIAQLGETAHSEVLGVWLMGNSPAQAEVHKSEAEDIVKRVLGILLECGLSTMGLPGAMEANPDIIQEFFGCMNRIAQDFTKTFYSLPPGALDALMRCAITALSLQERYSFVSACNFLNTLIHRSSLTDNLAEHKATLLSTHGRELMRAVLQGFAGVAPRSAVPNLIEILGTLMNRASDGPAVWIREILFADDFVPCKAGPEAKEKFIKAVVGSRSLKRIREAGQQFTLIARGLEGSSFGYASVTM